MTAFRRITGLPASVLLTLMAGACAGQDEVEALRFSRAFEADFGSRSRRR